MTTDPDVAASLASAMAPDGDHDVPDFATVTEPEPVVEPDRTCTHGWDPIFGATCEMRATRWRWRAPRTIETPVGGTVDEPGVWEPVCAEHGGFHINDESTATWAGRKVREARRTLAHVDALYAEELAKLNAWRDQARTEPQRTERFFTTHLVGYLRRLRRTRPTTRRLDLPSVTLRYSDGRQKIAVVDKDAFVAWAERSGHAKAVLRTTTEVLVGPSGDGTVPGLKKVLAKGPSGYVPATEDGEVVPGIAIEREPEWKVET